MALLKLSVKLHTLDADVINQVSPASPITYLLGEFRRLAVEALPLVDDMAALDGQSRLLVSCEVGAADTADATSGFLRYDVCAVIDDHLANHLLDGGPAAAFTSHIIEGIGPIVEGLPGLADFLAAIGIDDPDDLQQHISVGGGVTLYG